MMLHQVLADFADKPKIGFPNLLGAFWKREDPDSFVIARNKIQRAVNNDKPSFVSYAFHVESPLQQAPTPQSGDCCIFFTEWIPSVACADISFVSLAIRDLAAYPKLRNEWAHATAGGT